jgi:hypothetical protein
MRRTRGMAWHPPPNLRPTDADLAPYVDRAAVLTRDGARIGTLFLRAEECWLHVGGHLWWKKWSAPYTVVHGSMLFDNGDYQDWQLDPEVWRAELPLWRAGRMPWLGQELSVHWVDDHASLAIRREHFGDHPVPGTPAE